MEASPESRKPDPGDVVIWVIQHLTALAVAIHEVWKLLGR